MDRLLDLRSGWFEAKRLGHPLPTKRTKRIQRMDKLIGILLPWLGSVDGTRRIETLHRVMHVSCPHLFHSAFALSDEEAAEVEREGSVLDRSADVLPWKGPPHHGSNSLTTTRTTPDHQKRKPASFEVVVRSGRFFGVGTRVTWDDLLFFFSRDRSAPFPGPPRTHTQHWHLGAYSVQVLGRLATRERHWSRLVFELLYKPLRTYLLHEYDLVPSRPRASARRSCEPLDGTATATLPDSRSSSEHWLLESTRCGLSLPKRGGQWSVNAHPEKRSERRH
jgi:hypothetical protein